LTLNGEWERGDGLGSETRKDQKKIFWTQLIYETLDFEKTIQRIELKKCDFLLNKITFGVFSKYFFNGF